MYEGERLDSHRGMRFQILWGVLVDHEKYPVWLVSLWTEPRVQAGLASCLYVSGVRLLFGDSLRAMAVTACRAFIAASHKGTGFVGRA